MAQARSTRRPKTPPHISLRDLRDALGLKQAEVCDRMTEHTGHTFTKGALSAIESGTRGVSLATKAALEAAYGLPRGSIRTDYIPRDRALEDEEGDAA